MISRILTPEMQQAVENTPQGLRAYIEINLDPVLRLHTGLGERQLQGQTYYGIGELGSIGSVKENASQSSNRLSLGLRILDQALLTEALNTDMNDIEVYIHLVALNDKRKIAASQMYFYDGEITDKELVIGDLAKNIPYVLKVTCSDWYERWSQPPNAARCTDAAQQELYPGDKFFDQVEILAATPLSSMPVDARRSGGGGGGGGGNYRGGGNDPTLYKAF